VAVLANMVAGLSNGPKQPFRHRLEGWLEATKRRVERSFAPYLPGSLKSPEFLRHRYPGISIEEMRARVARFQRLLGDDGELKVDQLGGKLFRISG
jgi:hypothetical protein